MSSRLVTFRADGRVLHYSPGNVYTEQLNPLLETLLKKGTILILIDPLSLDEAPAPVKSVDPHPKPEKFVPTPRPVQAPVKDAKDNEESDEDKE